MTFETWLYSYTPVADSFWTQEDLKHAYAAATAAERERWVRECTKRARRFRSIDRRGFSPVAMSCANVLESLRDDMKADDE